MDWLAFGGVCWVLYNLALYNLPGRKFQMLIQVHKGLKGQVFNIRVDEILNKHFPLVLLPLSHYQVYVMHVHIGAPLLEYLCQLEFSQLPLFRLVIHLPVQFQDVSDVLFGFLAEENLLVSVKFVQAGVDKAVEEGGDLDAELFGDAFFMDDAHDNLVLFPVHQDLAVREQQGLFSHFVVHVLLEVEEHGEHVPTKL